MTGRRVSRSRAPRPREIGPEPVGAPDHSISFSVAAGELSVEASDDLVTHPLTGLQRLVSGELDGEPMHRDVGQARSDGLI